MRLATLVAGADAVIHVAGVVNAPDRAGLRAGQYRRHRRHARGGARRRGIRRFVHVSSLAAREPTLSNYGWSKAEAETRVQTSALDWTIVRPPAIYGPRDMRCSNCSGWHGRGIVPMPPAGTRISVIDVEDLTALLLALADDRRRAVDHRARRRRAGRLDTRATSRARSASRSGKRCRAIALPRALLMRSPHGSTG